MSKKIRIPELRFAGFDDGWEQKRLSSIVERVVRKNQELISELPLTISAQFGLIDQNEFFDKRIASKDVTGYYLIYKGEFAYNKSTSGDAPWGAIKRLDRYENGVLSTLYIVFKIKDENTVSSDYIAVYYDTTNWHKEVKSIAAEGARNHGLLNIAPSDFFDTQLFLPIDKIEQQKIGSYFLDFDKLISSQEKKLSKLINVKKSCLQKMFPRNDSDKPEIRFDGFSSTWKLKTLGSCFDERIESMPDGELLSVTIGSGIKKFADLDRHDSSNSDKSKYKKVCVGDIAYNSMRMWQGASGCSAYEGIVSPAYTVVKPKDGIDSQFFAYMFKKKEMIHLFEINSQGLTSDTWNLKYPAFSKIVVCVPDDIKEQRKIAGFLQNLDEMIMYAEQELELTKRMKKGCLQKMFV